MPSITLISDGLGASGVPGNFDVNYPAPLKMASHPDTQWEVALTQATYRNSIRNIRAMYDNNIFQYSPDAGVTTKQIIIPDGIYQVESLNDYIQGIIAANGDLLPGNLQPISIEANIATVRVVISCAAGYSVIWRSATDQLAALLGFDPLINIVGEIAYEGAYVPDVNRGCNMLFILCSLVTNTYRNTMQMPILYTTAMTGDSSADIVIKPPTPEYVDMSRQADAMISSVNIRFVDLQGREVDFDGAPTSVTIKFRAIDLGRPVS